MLNQEKIDKASKWFESMGYYAEEKGGKLYLECEGFSVELSEVEVEHRAEQWDCDQEIFKEKRKEKLEYYHEELSKLYNSELIQDPEQLYSLGDVLNIINTIKEKL
jgi:hypothetical protein